jgi:hypothetical protein
MLGVYYNTQAYAGGPDATFSLDHPSMTEVPPAADVTLDVQLDLNTQLESLGLKYFRDLAPGNKHSVTGSSAVWAGMWQMLSGTSLPPVEAMTADSMTVTAPDGDVDATQTTWNTFWMLLASKAISSWDNNGLTTKLSSITADLNTSPINTPILAPGLFAAINADLDPVAIDTPVDAAATYFGALCAHKYAVGYWDPASDPTDATGACPQFNDGEGFGFYVTCQYGGNPVVSGRISFLQQTPPAP